MLESTLRTERDERHAERLADARRAEALQRRVDTLLAEAEAAKKDPVSFGAPRATRAHDTTRAHNITTALPLEGLRWRRVPSADSAGGSARYLQMRVRWACTANVAWVAEAAGSGSVCVAVLPVASERGLSLQRLAELERLEARMVEMELRHEARQHELQVLPLPPSVDAGALVARQHVPCPWHAVAT